jgi:hypothetical protein
MSKSRYIKRHDGEWFAVAQRGHRVACCDCGLVHLFRFRLVERNGGRGIEMQAWRHERATAARRRKPQVRPSCR